MMMSLEIYTLLSTQVVEMLNVQGFIGRLCVGVT
jgi:hypothetical protein